MNSYVLERDRLQNISFSVSPHVLFIQESLSDWSAFSESQKAEVLNQVRLVTEQLKKNVFLSWRLPSLLKAVEELIDWQRFINFSSEIRESLEVTVTDPSGAPLDYRGEIDRDRLYINYLFDSLLGEMFARRELWLFLRHIYKTTRENTLAALTLYESNIYKGESEGAILVSFISACKECEKIGRWSRLGEITSDYYLRMFFTEMRGTGLDWFKSAVSHEPALKGMIRRTFVKRIIRQVWIGYWKTRIRFNLFGDYSRLIQCLSLHSQE